MSGFQAQLDALKPQLDAVNETIKEKLNTLKEAEANLKKLREERLALIDMMPFRKEKERKELKKRVDEDPLIAKQIRIIEAIKAKIKEEEKKRKKLEDDRKRVLAEMEKARQRTKAERNALQSRLTRGGLVPAIIYPVDESGVMKETYGTTSSNQLKPLTFMFNPTDYTISKKNKYKEKGLNSDRTYNLEFDSEIQPRQLTLSNVWFDTQASGEDVSKYTDVLMNFAEVGAGAMMDFRTSGAAIQNPPYVAFEWGTFRFMAVITNVNADFVLFRRGGTPVRAKCSITFKEFKHRKMYLPQRPAESSKPKTTHTVSAGERLDMIASQIYGNPSRWRLIAQANGITNPASIRPGQTLTIPSIWS